MVKVGGSIKQTRAPRKLLACDIRPEVGGRRVKIPGGSDQTRSPTRQELGRFRPSIMELMLMLDVDVVVDVQSVADDVGRVVDECLLRTPIGRSHNGLTCDRRDLLL
jgi:hypothetical protein